ncbi:hypothetical protein FOFC_15948 [Fusarium oxysporum]|nr:hypothetical protein FOFC_15948 [Fusarium oxysporum]
MSHCSFLNVTSNAAFSIVNVTAETKDMNTGFNFQQLLCIHVDGTGIYSIDGDATRKPLTSIRLTTPEYDHSYRRTEGIAIATKWLFIILIMSCSAWWFLLWIVPGSTGVIWGLWLVSVTEAISIIICMVVGRNDVKGFSFAVGTSTVSYGSVFYASLLITSILLAVATRELSRIDSLPAVFAKPYKKAKERQKTIKIGYPIISYPSPSYPNPLPQA